MIDYGISTRVFGRASPVEILRRAGEGHWDGLWWHHRQPVPESFPGGPGLKIMGYEGGATVGDSLESVHEAIRTSLHLQAYTLRLSLGHYDGHEADDAYLGWISRQLGRVYELAASAGLCLLLPVGGETLIQNADQAARLADLIPEVVQWSWVMVQPVPELEKFGRAQVRECHIRLENNGNLDGPTLREWHSALHPHLEGEHLQRLVVTGPQNMAVIGQSNARLTLEQLAGPAASQDT